MSGEFAMPTLSTRNLHNFLNCCLPCDISTGSSSVINICSHSTGASAPSGHRLPECFFPSTLLQLRSGRSLRADEVRPGDVLLGPSGEVGVLGFIGHPEVERDVVEVCAQGCTFVVTASHPVKVRTPQGAQSIRLAGEILKDTRLQLCTSCGGVPFSARRLTLTTPVVSLSLMDNRIIYISAVERFPTGFAVVRGRAEQDYPFGTHGLLMESGMITLRGSSARRIRSAPARCPDSLCRVRLKGRSRYDPRVRELLYELLAEALEQVDNEVLEEMAIHLERTKAHLNRGRIHDEVILPIKWALTWDRCCWQQRNEWRDRQSRTRMCLGLGSMSRPPRLQFQYPP